LPQQTLLQELEKAFDLVKVDINKADTKQKLTMIFAQQNDLQNYQPFKDALNKRWKEVES
jgi:hypothetical protein